MLQYGAICLIVAFIMAGSGVEGGNVYRAVKLGLIFLGTILFSNVNEKIKTNAKEIEELKKRLQETNLHIMENEQMAIYQSNKK